MTWRKKVYVAAAARVQAGLARARQAARMENEEPHTCTGPDAIPAESLHDDVVDGDPPDSPPGQAAGDSSTTGDLNDYLYQSGEESVEELEGSELLQNLEMEARSAYNRLLRLKSQQQWTEAENKLSGVHTGGAARTLREHRQKEQTKIGRAHV